MKFNHFPDKKLIKRKPFELHSSKPEHGAEPLPDRSSDSYPKVRVSDQLPKEVQDRRKQLIPVMIKARNSGQTANLSFDKLYINGKLYTAETASTSNFS